MQAYCLCFPRGFRLLGSVVAILGVLAGAGCGEVPVDTEEGDSKHKRNSIPLSIARYEWSGADFTNPRYSPKRLGKPLEKIDVVYDYDYDRLQKVEESLQGVERRSALRTLFQQITEGAVSNREKHLRMLKFLHKASHHNSYLQPMYPDRRMVSDPLVLLTLSEMRCGQVARIAVDVFAASGFRGRLVQLGQHVIAEIHYDGRWHYFDADLFGNGGSVFLEDGTIPSVVELSKQPFLIDSLTAFWEPGSTSASFANAFSAAPSYYPSYFYFARAAYGDTPVGYYEKLATSERERSSRYFGWEHLRFVPDYARVLTDDPPRFTPGAPAWVDVRLADPAGEMRTVSLKWTATVPEGGGYVVFVSRRSRGWNYDGPSMPADLMPFKSSNEPWNPGKYEARFTLPGCEVARVETVSNYLDLPVAPGEGYYITIMAFDRHGREAGRKLFPMSEEVCIRDR